MVCSSETFGARFKGKGDVTPILLGGIAQIFGYRIVMFYLHQSYLIFNLTLNQTKNAF